jgi:hypothetical protein
MYFLLYVPTFRKLMSTQQMQTLAAQLADQVLAQTVQDDERTPEAREAVREQLFEMMIKMQEQYPVPEMQNAESESEIDNETAPAELIPETPEMADMRNYLERCLKMSA